MSKQLHRDMILARTGNADLDTVFYVSLAGLGITELTSVVNSCVNIEYLDLSSNKLSDLYRLDGSTLPKLQVLRLENNQIVDVTALGTVPSIEKLYLQGNQIRDLRQICSLGRKLPQLRVLHLRELDGSRANPICAQNDYRDALLRAFPALTVLDGESLHLKKPISEMAKEILDAFVITVKKEGDKHDEQLLLEAKMELTRLENELKAMTDPSCSGGGGSSGGGDAIGSLIASHTQSLKVSTTEVETALGPVVSNVYEALADCLQMDMTLSETVQRVLDQADEEDNGSVGIG